MATAMSLRPARSKAFRSAPAVASSACMVPKSYESVLPHLMMSPRRNVVRSTAHRWLGYFQGAARPQARGNLVDQTAAVVTRCLRMRICGVKLLVIHGFAEVLVAGACHKCCPPEIQRFCIQKLIENAASKDGAA